VSQFAFLQREWAPVFESAARAETAVHADPRTACFYARRALELAVSWAYKHDASLKLPYQDNLSALIHDVPPSPVNDSAGTGPTSPSATA
jgi:type I restriction enzyme, R subunit